MTSETTRTVSSTLSPSDWKELVAAASTISERLDGPFLADETPASEALRQQRFDAWCHMVAAGDQEYFRTLLSWDGFDIPTIRQMLGHVSLREQTPLPVWTTFLQEVLHLVETLSCEQGVRNTSVWSFLAPDSTPPFAEILAPFVVVAQQRYARQADSAYHLLSHEAHATLQRHLLQVLTSFSLNTLHAAFLHQRSQGEASPGEQVPSQPVDTATAYQLFVKKMYQGGLALFLKTHSYLARLLATTTLLWIASHVEFLQRLDRDWSEIQYLFGEDSRQVIALDPALSDPHQGRRSVMALTLASGKKLVYKPRPVGMEVCYFRLLRWCNEHGATPPLKVLTILDRSTYGWMEFVAYEACQDEQAVLRYHRRAGMLLCLVYLLGGVDCSYEHIIAHGEHPVLIDPGMLLHHYPCPNHQDELFEKQCADWEQQQFSVLHTGLLASWQTNQGSLWWDPGKDISGLAVNETRHSTVHQPSHSPAQRSSPALRYGMLCRREHLNVPTYEGNLLSPTAYHTALCAGFTHLYQLLLSHRRALLAPDSPLQPLGQQTVRVLYHPHQTYRAHLATLLEPESLSDGVAYSVALERLWSEPIPVEYACWGKANGARWRQVYRAEQRELLQGDIPFFTARVDGDMLLADHAIASCLHQPSFDLLFKRVEHLSESDLRTQVTLIQHALYPPMPPALLDVTSDQAARTDPGKSEAPSSQTLLLHALALADALAEQAIPLENQAVTWIQPSFFLRSQSQQFQPIRYSLFNGTCGIALFLAAVAHISGETRYRTLARAALRPLCQSLHEDGDTLAREMGIGGAVGLGSVVYALTRISRFLDDPTLLVAAKEAAHLVRAAYIAHDRALDVIAGSAGAILGLLALYDASGDQNALDRAIACGDRLLQARTRSKAGCLSWRTLNHTYATGFSHGAAGIVYALLRLYTVTGDSRLLNAAREGLIYEDHAFVSSAGNWAETLTDEEPVFMATWCHGAPGIGLARVGGLPALDTARIRQDIEIALRTTQQVSPARPDHLCCGNSGRAEILLTAACKLGRPELAEAARQVVLSMLTRAEQKKTFLLNVSLPGLPLIGLFHGTSGIGYTLLRMAYPDVLPSVLLWE